MKYKHMESKDRLLNGETKEVLKSHDFAFRLQMLSSSAKKN
jgi:hypothetical protein